MCPDEAVRYVDVPLTTNRETYRAIGSSGLQIHAHLFLELAQVPVGEDGSSDNFPAARLDDQDIAYADIPMQNTCIFPGFPMC